MEREVIASKVAVDTGHDYEFVGTLKGISERKPGGFLVFSTPRSSRGDEEAVTETANEAYDSPTHDDGDRQPFGRRR